jgi:threonine synthase
MWRYSSFLPVDGRPIRYPLPVGGTPLVAAAPLRRDTGFPGLWLKDETRGPSASNKDRATALVLEDGLRRGLDTITTASTGNAAVATAVGAASVGVRAVIFVSTDCSPDKLDLMTQSGAWVLRVARGYAAAVDLSRAAAAEFGWLDRNTGVNPLTIEAKKTVALEIWEQLGRQVPDVVVAPVGDGPTLVALHRGFDELVGLGLAATRPRMVGVQAASCQPLVRSWSGEQAGPEDLDPGATSADGIAVLRPSNGAEVIEAVTGTGGAMIAVPEDELWDAVRLLASRAGIGAEPAGAGALAGAVRARRTGLIDDSQQVVALVTGRELTVSGPSPPRERVATVRDLRDVARAVGVGGAPVR